MKKYLFGILAIALAIGFSAFTSHKTGSTKEDSVYTFSTSVGRTIATLDMDDVIEPGNWTSAQSAPTDVTNGVKLAAIQFDEEIEENVDSHISLEQALEGLVDDYSGSAFSSADLSPNTGDATVTTIHLYKAN